MLKTEAAQSPRLALAEHTAFHTSLCAHHLVHVTFHTSVSAVTGSKAGNLQGKHHAEAQGNSSAASKQLEKLEATDNATVDASPQQAGDQQGGDLLDWENIQRPGVSALFQCNTVE